MIAEVLYSYNKALYHTIVNHIKYKEKKVKKTATVTNRYGQHG